MVVANSMLYHEMPSVISQYVIGIDWDKGKIQEIIFSALSAWTYLHSVCKIYNNHFILMKKN